MCSNTRYPLDKPLTPPAAIPAECELQRSQQSAFCLSHFDRAASAARARLFVSAFYLHNLRRRVALSPSLSSVFNAPAGWLAWLAVTA